MQGAAANVGVEALVALEVVHGAPERVCAVSDAVRKGKQHTALPELILLHRGGAPAVILQQRDEHRRITASISCPCSGCDCGGSGSSAAFAMLGAGDAQDDLVDGSAVARDHRRPLPRCRVPQHLDRHGTPAGVAFERIVLDDKCSGEHEAKMAAAAKDGDCDEEA